MNRLSVLARLPFQFRMANRLNRKQHLLVQLIAILPFLTFILLQMAMNVDIDNPTLYEQTVYFWVNGLIGLYWVVNAIKAGVARLHDCNHSGWWILLVIFLGFAAIFPYILLFSWPGTRGPNRFGSPLFHGMASKSLMADNLVLG